MIVNRGQSEQSSMIERSEIDTNLQLINTYSDIITRPVILDHVIEELEMEESSSELASKFTISNENNSQMFSITVRDENPYDAATIANTTASVFQEQMPEILNVDNVAILSVAEPNLNPVSPNNTLNVLIGIVLGAMVGVGTALLIEFLDNTVKDDRFIVEELGWTSLGRVSEMSADELKSDGRLAPNEETEQTNSRLSRSRV
jgi:capsular polysaccharide biosynthesis protein